MEDQYLSLKSKLKKKFNDVREVELQIENISGETDELLFLLICYFTMKNKAISDQEKDSIIIKYKLT